MVESALIVVMLDIQWVMIASSISIQVIVIVVVIIIVILSGSGGRGGGMKKQMHTCPGSWILKYLF